MNKNTRIWRTIIAVVTLLVLGFAGWHIRDILAYVLGAWVLSMIGSPIMNAFMKIKVGNLKMTRTIAALLTIFTIMGIMGLILALFIPMIIQQGQNLAKINYNDLAYALDEPITKIDSLLVSYGIEPPDKSPSQRIQGVVGDVFKPSEIGYWFSSILEFVGFALIAVSSVLFVAYFFLRERNLFINFLKNITPDKYDEKVVRAVEATSKMLTRYFTGILVQITIITLVVTLGLTLLGVPNAFLIGLFAGLANVIPYLGPIIGGLFGLLITISSKYELAFYDALLPLILKVIGVFVIAQLLDNFVLHPIIHSKTVVAHPVEVFLVIMIAAKIGGIPGMIIAIPAYTVIRIIAVNFLSEFQIIKKLYRNFKPSEIDKL